MTENKLKPCPFCGGKAYFDRMGTCRQSCIVECGSCGVRHESSDEYGRSGMSWNERHADRAAPSASAQQAPAVCDGKEQDAFEAWAKTEGMDMLRHPLHYLFLSGRTHEARQAWKAAIEYCAKAYAAPAPSASPASVPQGVVAWVRRGEDGILREEFLSDRAIEQVRRQSGGWLPMVLAAAQQSAASPADQGEDALDAKRYRWLRDSDRLGDDELDGQIVTGAAGCEDLLWGDRMDTAIDAAMSASKESPDA